jgi:cytoskeletal protein CcmA (bactofilin family)
MGFFNLESKRDNPYMGSVDSIVGEKAKFKGEISTTGSISLNGEFEGRVDSTSEVIIARGSKMRGDVYGASVIVSGTVDGNITATQTLEIAKTGRVHGDLTGGRIIIEEGSSYQGRVKVEGEGETEDRRLENEDRGMTEDQRPKTEDQADDQSLVCSL